MSTARPGCLRRAPGRHRAGLPALRRGLEGLRRHYGPSYLHTDPLGLVRRYRSPEDREIAGLVAAGLAYGRVAQIRRSLESVWAILGPSPRRFVERFDPRRDAQRFDGFVHRFNRGPDLALLLWLLRQALEAHGSLEALFTAGDDDPSAPTLEGPMKAFAEALFSFDARPFLPQRRVPRDHGARWLVPSPAGGSAAKRLCLYLRWMVRPDDGVDCGVWRTLAPSRLVMPLDTHIQAVSQAMGWTRRRSPGWPMALEVTGVLRRVEPEDPARYDFALSRLGMLGRPRPGAPLTRGRLLQVIHGFAL